MNDLQKARRAAAAKYLAAQKPKRRRANSDKASAKASARAARRTTQEAARGNVRAARAASRGTVENVITMTNIRAKNAVTLNKQTYDPRSLVEWYNTNPTLPPRVPMSSRVLSANEAKMVRRMADIANGAEGYRPLHKMFGAEKFAKNDINVHANDQKLVRQVGTYIHNVLFLAAVTGMDKVFGDPMLTYHRMTRALQAHQQDVKGVAVTFDDQIDGHGTQYIVLRKLYFMLMLRQDGAVIVTFKTRQISVAWSPLRKKWIVDKLPGSSASSRATHLHMFALAYGMAERNMRPFLKLPRVYEPWEYLYKPSAAEARLEHTIEWGQ